MRKCEAILDSSCLSGKWRNWRPQARVLVQVRSDKPRKISERRRTVRMIECNLQTSPEDPQGHLGCRWCHCAPLHKEKPCGRVMGKKPQTEFFEVFKKTIWTSQPHFGMRCGGLMKQRVSYLVIRRGINHGTWRCLEGWWSKIPSFKIQAPIWGCRKSYFLQKRIGGSTKYLIYFLLWCSNECTIFFFVWMHFLHHIFYKSIHPSIFYTCLLLHSGLQVFYKSNKSNFTTETLQCPVVMRNKWRWKIKIYGL